MIIERRMTKNPVTCSPDMSIQDASDLMAREHVHRLPVLDKGGRLVGVISEKDILKAAPSPASTLSAYETNYLLSKLTVKKIMSRNPVTVTKDTTVEDAATMMVDQDLSCLPVLEDGKLVGIYYKSSDKELLQKHQWTFDDKFFILLNQSVGNGAHGMIPDITKIYETKFDWIRVYQKK